MNNDDDDFITYNSDSDDDYILSSDVEDTTDASTESPDSTDNSDSTDDSDSDKLLSNKRTFADAFLSDEILRPFLENIILSVIEEEHCDDEEPDSPIRRRNSISSDGELYRRHIELEAIDFENISKENKRLREIRLSIDSLNRVDTSITNKILLHDNMPLKLKASIISKIENSCNSDRAKVTNWANEIMKLPLGVTKGLPVDKNSSNKDINDFLKKSREILDNTILGMENAKEELLDFLTNFINNGDAKGTILGLQSPPGCGKTQICRALSDILCLPFNQINFGGTTDSAILIGHDLTYIGSKCGKIAQILKNSECMNPIIYLDEVDKIGGSEKSKDIYGVLTHLLDETQNSEFEDHYFHDIPLDLSKVLFICSFNDETVIDPIVLNRIKVIKLKELNNTDKRHIVQRHILKNSNPHNVIFEDSVVDYIISEKTVKEPGMRNIKKNIITLINRINTMIMLEKCEDIKSINSNMSYSNYRLEYQEDRVVVTRKMVDIILSDDIDSKPWMSMYC